MTVIIGNSRVLEYCPHLKRAPVVLPGHPQAPGNPLIQSLSLESSPTGTVLIVSTLFAITVFPFLPGCSMNHSFVLVEPHSIKRLEHTVSPFTYGPWPPLVVLNLASVVFQTTDNLL